MARKTASRATAGAHTVTRLDQARVLAHPLRLRLLERFARGPCTTKQAAEALGEPPTRLYHHARALEKVGLIRLHSTRPNRGAVEKHYEAIARSFAVDPGLFAKGGIMTAAGSTADLVFERARAEVAAVLASGEILSEELGPLVSRIGVEGSPRDIAAIKRQLVAFIERIQKRGAGHTSKGAGPAPEGTVAAALTLAFAQIEPMAPPRASKGRAPRGKATR